MTSYQPTDEQIEALADQIAEYSDDERYPEDPLDTYRIAAHTYTGWPAVQAIIRAAVESALREAGQR